MQNLTLGDVVLIKPKSPLGGGQLAYVYDTYQDFDDKNERGVSLITEDGNNTGGWSKQEQEQYLEYARHSDFKYEFQNVIKLDQDFRGGVFNIVFKIKNELPRY